MAERSGPLPIEAYALFGDCRSAAPVGSDGRESVAEFTVRAGETADFVLGWSCSHQPAPPLPDAAAALAGTEEFWTDWSGRCAYRGRHRQAVLGSRLVLKSLSFTPTGAIVAAPTTSLPEQLGEPRNRDYRHCWLRDATLTLIAFMANGYGEEARAREAWLHRIAATVQAIEQELLVDGFVLRYRTESGGDGLPGGEGAFLPCSFWLARVWHLQGCHEKALTLFERLLSVRNDLGLLAEEYDTNRRRQVGNFPQAYSHLALIGAALTLDGVDLPAVRMEGKP